MRSQSGGWRPPITFLLHRDQCSTNEFEKFMISKGRRRRARSLVLWFVFLPLTNLPIANLHTIMASINGRTFWRSQTAHTRTQTPYGVRWNGKEIASTHLKKTNIWTHYPSDFVVLFAYRIRRYQSEFLVNWIDDWILTKIKILIVCYYLWISVSSAGITVPRA